MNTFQKNQNKKRKTEPSVLLAYSGDFNSFSSNNNNVTFDQLMSMIQTQNLLIQQLNNRIEKLENILNSGQMPTNKTWSDETPSYLV